LDASKIKELLERELELYRGLFELASRQQELIAAGEMDKLIPLLGSKQALLEKIGEAEAQLSPVKATWAEFDASLEPEMRSSIAEIVGQVEDVLAQIVALEKQGQEQLEAARRELVGEMDKLKRFDKAAKAYGAKPAAKDDRTRFFDQKK